MKYLTLASLPFMLWATTSQAIPVSYGTSTHDTTAWQELADASNNDPYGVSWSTDNGATWGRNNSLVVGQTVQFKFSMHKQNVGTHYADHLKAWVDWGQNGVFDTADQVAYGEHLLASAEPQLGSWKKPTVPDIAFYSAEYQLTKYHVGDIWLRALVTCSHSIVKAEGGSWGEQWSSYYTTSYENLLNPTGHYYQGETEEWKLTISDVPEPASLALLGLGLAGLAVKRRNK